MQKVYLKLPLEDIWDNRISILFTLDKKKHRCLKTISYL